MKRFAGLLLALSLAPQLSSQIFGPGVIHTGQGAPIKIIAPSTPHGAPATTVIIAPRTPQGAPATTVIINPPAPQVSVMQPQYGGYNYPYQPFHTHTQRGLPMHSMSMTPGFMYARPMYVRPTLGSMIIITPPMVDSMMPARTIFGR